MAAESRPRLVCVLPEPDLAPAVPLTWTGVVRAGSSGQAYSKDRLRGTKGSLRLFPQDVIDPAQGRGRMRKADGAG